MAFKIVAVLEEQGKDGLEPMAEDRSTEVRISIKSAVDWAWKIGVVIALLSRSYWAQDPMQRDIAELKARIEKLQQDSISYSRELSELKGSHAALVNQVSSEISQREAQMRK